ncbi:MAG: peptidylprolyl isomerase [Bacteroidetes bacterium SW_9_63_38]|nr:MAG: peptidylprolyl isomerase [Bacteroidetes bacterium SW_9_63_38]
MSLLSVSTPRRTTLCSLVLLVGVLLSIPCVTPSPAHAQDQTLDRIAAVVGDNIILTSEVDQLVRRQTQRGRASYSDDLWMKTLQNLIDQRLLSEKARRDTTLTLSEQQVSQQLDKRVQKMAGRAGGKERLEQIYGKSILEIKQQFRSDFRSQLLAQRLQQRRMRKADITPSEVRTWFEKMPTDSLPQLPKTVRLSHIVEYPDPSGDAKEQARTLAESVRDSIVSGNASFAAMARQYSDDTGTASAGGDLGSVNPDQLVPEFAAVASRTPVGEISQIFYNESQDGFHIVRVNGTSGSTVDLSHILIKVQSGQSTAERAKSFLNTIRDSIVTHGTSFAVMARRHSEEDRSVKNGGRVTDPQSGTRDLKLDALNPSWRNTIRTLDVGDISQPTKVKLLNSDEAYHIVRLDDRTSAHRANLKQDYDRIRQLALQEKRNREMQEWVRGLRDEVYVDVRVTKDDLSGRRSTR